MYRHRCHDQPPRLMDTEPQVGPSPATSAIALAGRSRAESPIAAEPGPGALAGIASGVTDTRRKGGDR